MQVKNTVLLNLAIPFIVDIIQDMITTENVVKVKNEITGYLQEKTGETTNKIDDEIIKFILEEISRNKDRYKDKFFDMIDEYVLDSRTKYDDRVVLPITKKLRVAISDINN